MQVKTCKCTLCEDSLGTMLGSWPVHPVTLSCTVVWVPQPLPVLVFDVDLHVVVFADKSEPWCGGPCSCWWMCSLVSPIIGTTGGKGGPQEGGRQKEVCKEREEKRGRKSEETKRMTTLCIIITLTVNRSSELCA